MNSTCELCGRKVGKETGRLYRIKFGSLNKGSTIMACRNCRKKIRELREETTKSIIKKKIELFKKYGYLRGEYGCR